MKKLFVLMFVSLLAISGYANSDLLNLSEIGLDTNQIKSDLGLSLQNDHLSDKSHEKNMHSITVNLLQIDLANINNKYPIGYRYWGAVWQPRVYNTDNLTEQEIESKQKREDREANKFAEEFEGNLKQDFLENIKRHTKSAKTTCQMVRINSNWLVGASSCLPSYIRENPAINSNKKEDVALETFVNAEEKFSNMYFIDNVEIEGITVYPVGNMFISQDLILLRLSDTQVNQTEKFVFSPRAKIDFSKHIESIYLGGKKIYGFKMQPQNYQLIYDKIRTYAGTPIFGEDNQYQEFLIGFNKSPYEDFTRGRSNKFSPLSGTLYQMLTDEMRDFIENTIAEYNKANTK